MKQSKEFILCKLKKNEIRRECEESKMAKRFVLDLAAALISSVELFMCVSLFIVFPLPKIQKEMYQTNNSHYKHQSQTNSKWNVSTKTGYSTLLYVVVFQGWLVVQDKLALKSGERENKAPFLLFFLFSSPLACYEMLFFFSPTVTDVKKQPIAHIPKADILR